MFNRLVTRFGKRVVIPTRSAATTATSATGTATNTDTQTPYIDYAAKYKIFERRNIADQYNDLWDKHRTRVNLPGKSVASPLQEEEVLRTRVQYSSFVAPSASLIGNVEIWDNASIWYNVVIKGDVNLVRIGAFVNVQDNTTIHEALAPLSLEHDGSTIIGHYTTIGHGCKLQACTIEEQCLVGMGSTLCEESYMETMSMLGAGSVLARGARVPKGELWVGNPAKFMRVLTEEEIDKMRDDAKAYWETAEQHKLEYYLPFGTAYLEAEKLGLPVGWTEDFWGNRSPKTYTGPRN